MKSLDFLNSYNKGTFKTIVTERNAKVRKGCPFQITKRTVFMGARLGINYDNMAQTEGKRESGELPTENAGLPWGQWEQYPYIIENKGKRYLRFYAQKANVKTTWMVNGKEVEKKAIESYLLASETPKPTEDTQLTLTMSLDNILQVR